MRGFQPVKIKHTKHATVETMIPTRSTKGSSGYDFYSKEEVTIMPNESHLFWTDVMAYMLQDETMLLFVRSSVGTKLGLKLKTAVSVIDSDYYDNEKNGGNIGICLYNYSTEPVTIKVHERIAQGVFQKYLIADNDICLSETRKGGYGSSGR